MFDALGYSESLASMGVPENQARLQAKELSKAFESNNLATTEDIVKLESKLTGDIVRLESKLITANLAMKVELIKWVAGMSFATMGVMFALLQFMLP